MMTKPTLLNLSRSFTAVCLALCLVSAVMAQPLRPPPPNFVLPDLSTVPGAITFTADKFDLTDSGFKYDGVKWITLDLPEHYEASSKIKVTGGVGIYTVVLDVSPSPAGTSTFWVDVNGKTLPPKEVKNAAQATHPMRDGLLMWTEVELSAETEITVFGKVEKPAVEGTATAEAKWTRMLLLPHNIGPPPALPPPPPPAR